MVNITVMEAGIIFHSLSMFLSNSS
jgi:hypothetical protein